MLFVLTEHSIESENSGTKFLILGLTLRIYETCNNSGVGDNWTDFNGSWIILILLENLDSKLFLFS